MEPEPVVATVVLARGGTVVAAWPLRSQRADLGVVDGLARLQLAALCTGCWISLRAPSTELAELLDLVGLNAHIVCSSPRVPRVPSMVSRWPVLVSLRVTDADYASDGRLTAAAVERLFAEGRRVYFAQCTTVDESRLAMRELSVRARDNVSGSAGMTVSVNVVEIYPDSFTMHVLIRPSDRDGVAAMGWCAMAPDGDMTTEMRDEFIALAHAAKHFH